MKRLSVSELVPGMILARDVISPTNRQVLLYKETILSDILISRLELNNTPFVFVRDQVINVLEDSERLVDPTYSAKIKAAPEFKEFKSEYEKYVKDFSGALNEVVEKNSILNADELLAGVMGMATKGANGRLSLLDMIMNMRDYDDSTYAHSMNVALLCNLIATWMGYDNRDVELATLCGLFHDIGKLVIPIDILGKPAKLTSEEYAVIQKHSQRGYEILSKQNVDKHVMYAALMHHERIDGSGYPLHLKENEIDIYARMVSIADVYDAMTSARVYRGALCPFRVIELFEKEGYEKYDVTFLLTFLENVVRSYISNTCRLSDGREGEIIFVNPRKPSRPIVKCGDVYVDLSLENASLIVETLL